MVRLEHVRKVFRQGHGELRALDDVSLDVARGEFLSVMGPSGSGKSTMLHLMAGLDVPTAGEIFVAGRPLSGLKDDEVTLFRRRQIGFVFQFFNLLPTLTAEENVALPLLLDGRRMREVREPVGALLDLVGLGNRRSHRPDEMSGGEMQRVAVARALAIEPALLLADEPTGNLDTETGTDILELIKRITVARALTVVLVTHDLKAARYGDRAVTMRDGRLTDA
jgi:putative ABC transport system ATP-binding protein